MRNRLPTSLASLVAIGVGSISFAACSGQGTYSPGEPLATVSGSIVTSGPAAASIEVAVIWLARDATHSPTLIVGSRVAITADSPAGFTLPLFAPPAEGERRRSVHPVVADLPTGVWEGRVVALRARADHRDIQPSDIAGIDLMHRVVYFGHDGSSEPSSVEYAASLAEYFQVPFTEGYHLGKEVPKTADAQDAYDRCRWAGLCIRIVDSEDPLRGDSSAEYARCMALTPSSITCTITYGDKTPEQVNELDRCAQLRDTMQGAARTRECDWLHPALTTANPRGFEDPVMIVLGEELPDGWRD